MNYVNEFLLLTGVCGLAIISPGPDFAIVVRNSFKYSSRSGVLTALGIASANLVHTTYTVLGLGLVISQSIVAFNVLKLLGAAYLVYVGIAALKSKAKNTSPSETETMLSQDLPTRKAFMQGFLTNVLNPKCCITYLSIFSVLVSAETPAIVKTGYGVWIAALSFLWFAMVSLLFANARVRDCFIRMGHWFDRVTGGIFVALGLRLALAAAPQ